MALTKVTSALTNLDGGITIDNITIDGTEIDLSSGNLTIDVAGDIALDCGGGDINLQDDGTQFASLENDGTNFIVKSERSDADMLFKVNDGGSSITALTIDSSEAGRANFGDDISLLDGKSARFGTDNDSAIFHSGSAMTVSNSTGDFTIDTAGDIVLDADGGDINLKDDGSSFGAFINSSLDFVIRSSNSDSNLHIQLSLIHI